MVGLHEVIRFDPAALALGPLSRVPTFTVAPASLLSWGHDRPFVHTGIDQNPRLIVALCFTRVI